MSSPQGPGRPSPTSTVRLPFRTFNKLIPIFASPPHKYLNATQHRSISFSSTGPKHLTPSPTGYRVFPCCTTFIMALYHQSSFYVQELNDQSPTCIFGRGIRQGCPLSPYVLSLLYSPLLQTCILPFQQTFFMILGPFSPRSHFQTLNMQMTPSSCPVCMKHSYVSSTSLNSSHLTQDQSFAVTSVSFYASTPLIQCFPCVPWFLPTLCSILRAPCQRTGSSPSSHSSQIRHLPWFLHRSHFKFNS